MSYVHSTRGEYIEDFGLYGIDTLLRTLPDFDAKDRASRAVLLWQALADIEREAYSASYHWFYYSPQSDSFDSQFVKLLNEVEWIPDSAGDLHTAATIYFDDLGWQDDSFLRSKILFKPPTIGTEATRVLRSMGIADDVLERLQRLPLDQVSDLLRDALQGVSDRSRADKRRRAEDDSDTRDEEHEMDSLIEPQADSPTI